MVMINMIFQLFMLVGFYPRDPMDYSGWKADREGYFSAIQHSMAGDYGTMRWFVRQALPAQE
jgi:hypothetical protein